MTCSLLYQFALPLFSSQKVWDESSTDGSVKCVVIGPTEERELAFHSLKMMSLDKGFEIHSTEVPLR